MNAHASLLTERALQAGAEASRPIPPTVRPRPASAQALRHLALLTIAVFSLLPFAWMLSTASKPETEIYSAVLHWFPTQLALWENLQRAFAKAPLLRFMLNGVIVTATIFALQMLVALPAAYALAKLEFRGRPLLMGAVLLGLLVPQHAVAVPVFLLLHVLGLLDSYAALIAPWTLSVFGIFLLRQFFKTVPDDLIAAARIDGLSEFSIVWRVMLPTAWPAVTAFGIFSVVAHWNDYFWPLIVINSPQYLTPALGVAQFRNQEAGTQYGPLMAAAIVVITPLVVGFLLAQRRFIEGITLTGLK